MDESDLSRARIFNTLNAAILALALPLLLAGCGGGTDTSSASGTGAPATTAGTPNSAALAWDPPSSAANISGYRVYYGTAPGSYIQSFGQGLSVGNVTSYTLMGLSNGIRYYFAVTAIDSLGNESTYSNQAFKDIP